jgi:signal peptide peptidase SppA
MNMTIDTTWAIEPLRFAGMLQHLRGVDPNSIQSRLPRDSGAGNGFTKLDGGIALIEVGGVLTKYPSIWQWIFGGSATTDLERTINAALNDPAVSTIVLKIDSPGGSVSGIHDLADLIFAARQRKVVVAYASDTAASAAYLVGSQASKVFGNASAIVGSIGVFSVLYDSSKLFDREGVTVHVVKSDGAAYKGVGVSGTKVSDDQLREVQRVVDSFGSLFTQTVARGRGMSVDRVRKMSDGRVHVGEAARALGLIDGVYGFDQVIAGLQGRLPAVEIRLGGPLRKEGKAQMDDDATIEAFENAVAEKMKASAGTRRPVGRSEAIRAVVRENPELHSAYVSAFNSKHRKRR